MASILLTSVCRPFGGPGEGDSVGAELFHAQVTRAQGPFSFRQVIRCWAIDYIAANIGAPAVVLHYPSEGELIRELSRGHYDYVGISFVVATFHKVRRMARLIWKHSPGSKIILGGYGTVLPDDLLAPFGDHVCREEGIRFMRRLLGEREDRPIRHPYAPIPGISVYSVPRRNVVGHVTAGLGCPNGCDFCCTSHFFKRRYVPFARTGRQIYEAIRDNQLAAAREGHELNSFILIDEDFFLYERRAREFLACVREGGRPLSLMGFGSVRGLSQFSADEIAEMGFDTIWTAFEGAESGFRKLEGRPLPELYASLKSRGIAILSSMILGFPYQDRERIVAEFEQLTSLGPTMTQMLIYFAFPGTPLHRKVVEEGWYRREYRENPDLRRWDGFSMHFRHPHLQPDELESLQRELYRREFELLGPSIQRVLRVWLEGYRNLRDSPVPLLRARAELKRKVLIETAPALGPAIVMGPTRATRSDARALLREIAAETGGLPLGTRLSAIAAPAFAAWTWLAQKLDLFQQPALLRIEHAAGAARPVAVDRLQGGLRANPVSVLAEDLARGFSRAISTLTPTSDRPRRFRAGRTITRPSPMSARGGCSPGPAIRSDAGGGERRVAN